MLFACPVDLPFDSQDDLIKQVCVILIEIILRGMGEKKQAKYSQIKKQKQTLKQEKLPRFRGSGLWAIYPTKWRAFRAHCGH